MTQPSGSNRNTCLNRLRVREDMLRAIGTGDPAPENRPGSAVSGAAAPLDNLVDGMVMLDHVAQRFLLHWMEVARECQRDLALHFAPQAVRAVELMDLPGVERWALAVMDDFDKRGLGAAIATIERLEEFAAATRSGNTTVAFPEAAGFLRLFLVGLGGRELKLEMADATCTDTETIFVPAACGALATAAENRRRYKLMVAWHWAQCLHGPGAPRCWSQCARGHCPQPISPCLRHWNRCDSNTCLRAGCRVCCARCRVWRRIPCRKAGRHGAVRVVPWWQNRPRHWTVST